MVEPKRGSTISPSQLESMGCRLAWYWQYKEGYRSKRNNIALDLGTAIHAGLEEYYGKGLNPVEVFKDWVDKRIAEINPQWQDDIEKLQEARTLGIGMLEGYLQLYEGKERFEVLATEKTLSRKLPIPGTGKLSKCNVVVRLDGLVRDLNDGHIYSLEHKTFKTFNANHLDRDHQFTAQVWCGQALADEIGIDEKVYGVIYNGLRKQLPSPRVKSNLFERHKIYRTQRHIEVFLHRAYWQYRELSKSNVAIYPQPNAIKCSSCNFKEVCTEYMSGGDWQFLLNEFFTKRS